MSEEAALFQNVSSAFELLFEAIQDALIEVKKEGEKAFSETRLTDAGHWLNQAKEVQHFEGELSVLHERWSSWTLRNLRDDPQEIKVRAKTQKEDTRPSFSMSMLYKRAKARGIYSEGRVVLQAGAVIGKETFPSLPDPLKERRDFLIGDNSLANDTEGLLKLNRDLLFGSPSSAAQFVAGCSVSGNREWMVDGSGLQLGAHLKRAREEMLIPKEAPAPINNGRAWGVWKAKGRAAAPQQVTGPIDWERRALHAEKQKVELTRRSYKYDCLRSFLIGLSDSSQLADLGQHTPEAQRLLSRILEALQGIERDRDDTWKNFNVKTDI
jgi:hypothetical protein